MHWSGLIWETAPHSRKLLFHLHSRLASQAAGASPTALHAASSSLPSSNLSSAASYHPSGFVHFLSTFCCFLIPRRFLISSQPTCLSLLLLASAAPRTEHHQGRDWEGTVGPDQTLLCSLYSNALANTAMRWAGGWSDKQEVILLMPQKKPPPPKKKKTKTFSTDSCRHLVELICYTKIGVQLKPFS